MRVVHINATNGVGSTGNIALSIHKKVIEDGGESYVLWGTKSNTPPAPSFIKIGNWFDHKLHAFLSRLDKGQGFHSTIATKKACKEIQKLNPDIVHLHNLHSNYMNIEKLLGFLKEQNIPVVITLHDCWFFTGYCYYYQKYSDCMQWKTGCKDCPAVSPHYKKKVRDMFEKKRELFSNWDKVFIVGVSKWTVQDAEMSILSNTGYKTCIYNWVESEDSNLTKSKAEICKKYGVEPNKKIILGVAQGWNVGNSKGADEFIEISKRYNDKAEVVLVGNNIDMPELSGLHCIGYTSSKNELEELYSIADVFVNPSKFETFGLVNVEAMSCGTSVIAYENTSAIELIGDEYGILVPNGDFDGFINAVGNFINSEQPDKSLKLKNYVNENFNKKLQLDKYVDLYRAIVNNIG